jgi:hypothetical protein
LLLVALAITPALGFGLAALCASIALGAARAPQAVYSVTQVLAGLRRDPTTWTQRTLLVHGMAVNDPCPARYHHVCRPHPQFLLDELSGPLSIQMPLVVQSSQPALTVLRRIPFLGSLLPQSHRFVWDTVGEYRVRLRAMPQCPSADPSCYEAVVQDGW